MIPLFRSLRFKQPKGPYAFTIEQNDPYISDEPIWTITHQNRKEAFAFSPNAFSRTKYRGRFTEDAKQIVDALNASHGRNATIWSVPRSIQKRLNPRFAYGCDGVGVDDLWIIWDRWTRRDLACRVFWDCSPEWMMESERDIIQIVEALNARVSLVSAVRFHCFELISILRHRFSVLGARQQRTTEW